MTFKVHTFVTKMNIQWASILKKKEHLQHMEGNDNFWKNPRKCPKKLEMRDKNIFTTATTFNFVSSLLRVSSQTILVVCSN